ncbi:phosphatase PAP2 family protein [Rhodopila sp.]|uniref:phosphatase PAP2 family protein n=1 Tax=Rhodopila sp. TaxID=2480087 RepID=UPI003D14EFE4
MRYLTDFADQAVIIPLVIAIAIGLAFQGWRRGASAWLLVVAATFSVMLALKLMFLSCTPVFGPFDVRSPSGHVAAATMVAGGLAAILSGRRDIILPVALLAAVVVGISRLVLGAHSLPEVVLGAAVGLTGAIALLRFSGAPPRLNIAPLVAVMVAVAVLFHGLHLPAEAAIRHTAYAVAKYVPVCRGTPQFQRHLAN